MTITKIPTSKILRSPKSILGIVLMLVFLTEFLVMVNLPILLPRPISKWGEALLDAVLLTLVITPVLWWLIHAAKQAEEERLLVAREAEALRAQQMATLAQLATGVAHEIRNPLTSVKMLVQVHLDILKNQGLSTEDMQIVEQEIRRMERSVNSLLDFARPEKSEFKRFSIQELVSRTVKLIQGRCESQQIVLQVQLPEPELFMVGDAMQIQQVLINLCLNALDVMPKGGELVVRAETDNRSKSDSPDETLIISVSDCGPGIDVAQKQKIFQPFFTTKSNGIGLGLGICERIAKAHGGSIDFVNNPVCGATFSLSLPMRPSTEKSGVA